MTQRTRTHLKQEFQDGERPAGSDFADLIDSSLNKQDDGVQIEATDSTLVLARGLRLGDSADAQAGTLRFNGGVPQFHDGTSWTPIGGGGGGGAFQSIGAGADVAYTGGGTVGIGSFSSPSTYRFEVQLGANSGTAEQARFGTAVVSNGSGASAGSACFSHFNHATNSNFALRQGATGNVDVNAPTGAPIQFRQNGSAVRLAVSSGGHVLVRTTTEIGGSTAALQVSGNAIKSAGGGAWLTSCDARVKQDIRDYETGLEAVRAIRPVKFRYNGKAGTLKDAEAIGVLGQEIETILPETVARAAAAGYGDEELYDLRIYDGNALTYVLVNAVKQLAARVDELEAALLDARGSAN